MVRLVLLPINLHKKRGHLQPDHILTLVRAEGEARPTRVETLRRVRGRCQLTLVALDGGPGPLAPSQGRAVQQAHLPTFRPIVLHVRIVLFAVTAAHIQSFDGIHV